MNKPRKYFDINRRINKSLKEHIKSYKRIYVLKEIDKELEKHPTLPIGSATRSIREDRDQR